MLLVLPSQLTQFIILVMNLGHPKPKLHFYNIGLVSTFITGGLTGIILGDSTLDINVHGTYFVVAHFHLVMGISALYGMFAGIYHWFPRMYGRMLNKTLGYVHFWVTAVCAYGVFFPMHFIGMAGLPRRYYTNTNFPIFDDMQDVNVVITMFTSAVS